jgi:hypothetical protein
MEKSLARKRFGRDLSAPWLRHSGRDARYTVLSTIESLVSKRFAAVIGLSGLY